MDGRSRKFSFSQFDGPYHRQNNVEGTTTGDGQSASASSYLSMPSIPSIEPGLPFGEAATAGAVSFAAAAASAASPLRPVRGGGDNDMIGADNRNVDAGNAYAASSTASSSTTSTNPNGNCGTTTTAAASSASEPATASSSDHSSSMSSIDPVADQERQILLLVLLAQVCAMHDATPRTFTVHVLDLYERGLLDRSSIEFLFELGLVPAISTNNVTQPTNSNNNNNNAVGLLMNSSSTTTSATSNVEGTSVSETIKVLEEMEESTTQAVYATTTNTTEERIQTTSSETALMTTTQTGTAATTLINQIKAKRIIETKAIRRQLSLNDQAPNSVLKKSTTGQQKLKNSNSNSPRRHGGDATGDNDDDHNNDNKEDTAYSERTNHSSIHDKSDKPWEVEHFPLSLSRYQREFRQIKILNRGSFGQVFHCIRLLDNCDYAIKKIPFDARGYESQNIQRVMREVECLASVSDHPNVVHYYTSWLEPSWMTGNVNNNNKNGRHRRQQQQQQPAHQYLLEAGASGTSRRRESPSNRLLRDLQNLVHHTTATTSDFSSSAPGNDDFSSLYDRRGSGVSIESVGEESWDTYQSHSLEPFGQAMDDSSQPFSWDDSTVNNSQRRTSHQQGGAGARHQKQEQQQRKSSQYRYQIFLFIQMQLCHPATLADWIRERNKRIPECDHEHRIGPALGIFTQIVAGLSHIHGKGIIHRDLKPANIFASKDGKEVLIGDFGLSKQLRQMAGQEQLQQRKPRVSTGSNSKHSCQEESTDLTVSPSKKSPVKSDRLLHSTSNEIQEETIDETNVVDIPVASTAIVPVSPKSAALSTYVMAPIHHSTAQEPLTAGIGTATYAAPEQVKSKSYGSAVDIFSLGLILLELVCCFETEHERLDWFNRVRTRQCVPTFLQEHYPQIASTILACTRPRASDRPSARELAELYKPEPSPANALALDVQFLRNQLKAKDKQLAEKDETIESMRAEIERMKLELANAQAVDSKKVTNEKEN